MPANFGVTLLDGGLILNNPPVLSEPGTLSDCLNFEVAYASGYKRMDGYERFDGGPSPSDQVPAGSTAGAFFEARDAAYLTMRANVQPVPGSGPVVGTFWLRDELYAARDVVALSITALVTDLVAGDVIAAASWSMGDPVPFYGTVLRTEPSDVGSQVFLYNTRGTPPTSGTLYRGTTAVATVTGSIASPGAALYRGVGTRGGFGAGSWEYQDLGYVLNYVSGEILFPSRNPGTVEPAEIQTTVWKVADLTIDSGQFWNGLPVSNPPTVLQVDDGDTSFAYKLQTNVLTGVVDRSFRIAEWGFDDTDVPAGSLITGVEVEIVRRAYYSDAASAVHYWTDYDLRLAYPDVTPTPGAPGVNFADTLTQWPQSGVTPDSGTYTTATYGGEQNNLGYGNLTPERLKDPSFALWVNAIYSLPVGSLAPINQKRSEARITFIRMRASYAPPSPSFYIWNGTSAVFIEIVHAYQQSGDVSTMDAAGVLYITPTGVTREIASGEEIRTLPQPGVTPDGGAADGSSLVALTSSGMTANLLDGSAAITESGSKYQYITTNFTTDNSFAAFYGVSGAGPAFFYDGTAFARILTGLSPTLEKPRHVVRYQDRLVLGYQSGDVRYSNPLEPTNWDAATGTAGYASMGAPVTGLIVMNGQTLGIGTRDDFQMIQNDITTGPKAAISPNVGCIEYSMITTGNYVYTSNRGIQGVQQTPSYGDFDSGTLSEAVWPWLADRVQQPLNTPPKQQKRNLTNSVAARAKHQYRTYYADGYILTATFLRAGETPQYTFQYNPSVWDTVQSVVESTGRDRIFGSYGLDGYVYELDKGNRFDADAIAGYIILTADDLKTPFMRKQFSNADVHGSTYGWADFAMSRSVSYDLPTPSINYPQVFGASTSTSFSDPANFVSRGLVRTADGFSITLRFDVNTGSQSPVTLQAVCINTIVQGTRPS